VDDSLDPLLLARPSDEDQDEEAASPDGPTLTESRFEAMLDAYYDLRGWGPNGRPTRETLARLGLLSVRDDATPVDHSDNGTE
jgi:aldehyde:ferredoxin oxidoreductase